MRGRSSKTVDQYVPSGRDIRDACRIIQSGWSDHERRKRAGLPRYEPWAPPFVHASQLGDTDIPIDS